MMFRAPLGKCGNYYEQYKQSATEMKCVLIFYSYTAGSAPI